MRHTDPLALRAAVGRALDGGDPLVVGAPDAPLPPGTALALPTSGSTGSPRHVALSAEAVLASGAATADRLGGPAHWTLALPLDHVAGVQVVARAHVAGLGLTTADPGPFTPEGFVDLATRSLRDAAGAPRHLSLVPTQIHRIVEAADAGRSEALDALARFDAVLVGGAALPSRTADRAATAGVEVVETYGMTETCGGCVYDGEPLDGVGIRLVDGVVEISGPVLALGYVGADDDPAFHTDPDGGRWFRTRDLGSWAGEPRRLGVLGRVDDVIVTGGVNVAPAAVEAVAALTPGVGEVCVVGVPDPEWGRAVVAVLTAPGTQRSSEELAVDVARRVADSLGRAAVPRRVVVVPELPRRGPGKVDRRAVARLVPPTGGHA